MIFLCLLCAVHFPSQATFAADDTGIHELIILFDNSVSMNWNDPAFLAPDVLTQILDSLPAHWCIGLVTFNADVVDFVPPAAGTRPLIRTILERTRYINFTNAGAGLLQAIELFSDNAHSRTIIFMTDGEMVVHPTKDAGEYITEDVEILIAQAIARVIASDIQVHTIAVGGGFEGYHEAIINFASATGGYLFRDIPSANLSEIASVLVFDVLGAAEIPVDTAQTTGSESDDYAQNECAASDVDEAAAKTPHSPPTPADEPSEVIELDSPTPAEEFDEVIEPDPPTPIENAPTEELPILRAERRSLMPIILIACFALAIANVIYLLYHRSKRVKILPPIISPENRFTFAGKLDLYIVSSDDANLSPQTFRLGRHREISLQKILRKCRVRDHFPGSEHIFLVADKAGSLQVVNNSDCMVSIGSTALAEKQSHTLNQKDSLNVQGEDGVSKLVINPRFLYRLR